jgi:hypothetical protein
MDKLPLYKMFIADDIEGEEEVDFVALVESPAIQRNFLAFAEGVAHYTADGELYTGATHKDSSGRLMTGAVHTEYSDYLYHKEDLIKLTAIRCKECGHVWALEEGGKDPYICHLCGSDNTLKVADFTTHLSFAVQDEDQRIVSGPLMIADLPIYRKDEDGEYYVMFTGEQIKKIVQRFFKKGYQAKVNIEHGKKADGVYMFESYIIDRDRGVNPPTGFEDVADGSWFGSFKVENEKLWSEVKAGTFKGFSVEGLFRYEKAGMIVQKEEQIMSQIFKILSQVEQN